MRLMKPDLKPDPIGDPRHPLAIYLLVLCCLVGIANLLGLRTGNAVNDALGAVIERAWNITLSTGCGATLVGMFWQGNPATGLAMKRWGMYAVTMSGVVYSLVILVVTDGGGWFISGLVAGLAWAAYNQYRRILVRINVIKDASP